MNINEVVKEKLSPYLISKSKKSFLLLVSGGMDSIVLFNILIKIIDVKENKLFLLHCNYNENQNCLLAESMCRKIAIENKVKIFIRNVKLSKNNFEHNARLFRYDIASKISQKFSIDVILTAHHYDDQLETLYMQKYFKADWLSSLGIRQIFNKINRPMLLVNKKHLHEFAIENNIKWVHDTTNDNMNFLRNKIRKKIIPNLKNNNPNEILVLFSDYSLNHEKYIKLKNAVVKNQPLYILNKSDNFFEINNSIVKEVSENEIKLYYQIYTKRILNIDIRATNKHWLNFIKFIHFSYTGKYFKLNNEIDVIKDRNKHIIYKSSYLKSKKIKISNKTASWFDTKIIIGKSEHDNFKVKYRLSINKSIINDGLYIRNWQFGDKCYSRFYNKYISLSNIFINNKISNFEKAQYPIVINANNEIISVPNLYNKFHYSTIDTMDLKNIYWTLQV